MKMNFIASRQTKQSILDDFAECHTVDVYLTMLLAYYELDGLGCSLDFIPKTCGVKGEDGIMKYIVRGGVSTEDASAVIKQIQEYSPETISFASKNLMVRTNEYTKELF